MIKITSDPKNKVYKELINLAFEKCDKFHLVIRKDMDVPDTVKMFLKQLDSSLIEVKEESEWASNILGDNETAFVYYYYTDNHAKSIIYNSAKSLYDWVHPKLPEDLSFFQQEKEWLATNSHEKECYILTNNSKEIEQIMNIKGLKIKLED